MGNEPEFPLEGLSEEEIAKWSTDETFSEFERFQYLLNKGFPEQKSAVIHNLPTIVNDTKDLAQLFPQILDLAPTWDNNLQSQLGGVLTTLIRNGRLPMQYKGTIISITVRMLNSGRDGWNEFFNSFVKVIEVEDVLGHFMPCVYSMCSYSRSPTVRLQASKIVGALIARVQTRVEDEVLNRIISLTTDSESSIRTQITQQLYQIAKALGQTTAQTRIVPEVLRMLDDDDIDIQADAIEGFAKI